MREDGEVVPAPATNQNRKRVATKAAWPVGELAGGGSENGLRCFGRANIGLVQSLL